MEIVFCRQNGKISIAENVAKSCSCGGIHPYISNAKPCPLIKLHRKIDSLNYLYNLSAIPEKYRFLFLSSFAEDTPEKTKNFVAKYIKNFPSISGLYIYGHVGTGKTHLASVIANELIVQKNQKVYFFSVRNEIENQKINFSKGINTDIFEKTQKFDLVILDDFMIADRSTWEKEFFFNIINNLYLAEKKIIITSNFPVSSFKNIFENRIASRIYEMCFIVEVNGKDRRKNATKKILL